MNKEQILRRLYRNKVNRDNFIDAVPDQYREIVSSAIMSDYVNWLYQDNEMMQRVVFQEHWDSVEWFLYDWQPGFEVGVRGDSIGTPIYSIDEFIKWMKLNEGFE